MGTIRIAAETPLEAPPAETVDHEARLRSEAIEAADAAARPRLYSGELYQVQDNAGTWHAAAVGPGVLCPSAELPTHTWDYGTDHVDCPELACLMSLGRA